MRRWPADAGGPQAGARAGGARGSTGKQGTAPREQGDASPRGAPQRHGRGSGSGSLQRLGGSERGQGAPPRMHPRRGARRARFCVQCWCLRRKPGGCEQDWAAAQNPGASGGAAGARLPCHSTAGRRARRAAWGHQSSSPPGVNVALKLPLGASGPHTSVRKVNSGGAGAAAGGPAPQRRVRGRGRPAPASTRAGRPGLSTVAPLPPRPPGPAPRRPRRPSAAPRAPRASAPAPRASRRAAAPRGTPRT
jgi:hypothetical protein